MGVTTVHWYWTIVHAYTHTKDRQIYLSFVSNYTQIFELTRRKNIVWKALPLKLPKKNRNKKLKMKIWNQLPSGNISTCVHLYLRNWNRNSWSSGYHFSGLMATANMEPCYNIFYCQWGGSSVCSDTLISSHAMIENELSFQGYMLQLLLLLSVTVIFHNNIFGNNRETKLVTFL